MEIVFAALFVGVCALQRVALISAQRFLNWTYLQRQVASGGIGLLVALAISILLPDSSLWIPICFCIYWAWQLFLASILEKSLSIRVLLLIGHDDVHVSSQLLSSEISRQFEARAQILARIGQVQRIGEVYCRGPQAQSCASKIDAIAMQVFDVQVGNLY